MRANGSTPGEIRAALVAINQRCDPPVSGANLDRIARVGRHPGARRCPWGAWRSHGRWPPQSRPGGQPRGRRTPRAPSPVGGPSIFIGGPATPCSPREVSGQGALWRAAGGEWHRGPGRPERSPTPQRRVSPPGRASRRLAGVPAIPPDAITALTPPDGGKHLQLIPHFMEAIDVFSQEHFLARTIPSSVMLLHERSCPTLRPGRVVWVSCCRRSKRIKSNICPS